MRLLTRSGWRALGLLAILLILLAAAQKLGLNAPEDIRAVAVDGDSLRVSNQDYRLHAIDAPELHQNCSRADGSSYPCGREAQKALRAMVQNRTLTCRTLDEDRYGRLVAECTVNGVSINDEMVRAGWAVAYRRHGRDHVAAEAEARTAKRGIWQGRFEMPENWRNANRSSLRSGAGED
ncbi:thermonuclease family protein [Aestuariivirga sp.]|uniref:thermonuclease family protein n=1 Tax=Aestuariivirga sp. TaxID=2650926 RepID=UPI003BA8B7A3